MYPRFRPLCLLCVECLTLSHNSSGSYCLHQTLYRLQYKTCRLYFAHERILSARILYDFCLSTVLTRNAQASFVTYDNFIVLIIELHCSTHFIIFCHSVIVRVFISTISSVAFNYRFLVISMFDPWLVLHHPTFSCIPQSCHQP